MSGKRAALTRDALMINDAAKTNLFMKRNVEKGEDSWYEAPLFDLICELQVELEELKVCCFALDIENQAPVYYALWRIKLIMEAGDVLNYLAILCERLGGFEEYDRQHGHKFRSPNGASR